MRLSPIPLTMLLLLTAACGTNSNAIQAVPTTPTTPVATTSSSPLSSAAPASSSPAETLPTGFVLLLPDRGVTFSSTADIAAVTWLTSDEKAFLVSELTRLQAPRASCATIAISGYRVADLLVGRVDFNTHTAGCMGSGSEVLYGKVSGSWKILTTSQQVPSCSSIRDAGWKSTIPKEFFGGVCVDGNETDVDYKP